MSKKVELYFEDELFDLIAKQAEAKDIAITQYIPEVLSQYVSKDLSSCEMYDFSDQLQALRDAVLRYALSLEDQKEFLLRDVPEYANNTNISGSMRIRLARSINEMICKSQKDGSLSSVIERVYRKDGTTPKLRGGAAVYRKKEKKS